MIRRSFVFTVVLLPCTLMSLSCVSLAWSDEFSAGQRVGVLETTLVQEASGIVASRCNAEVLWIHNDSGGTPQLFAIDAKARLLGVCTIRGIRARDWEDIAIGPGPEPDRQYLYIGDIGDNLGLHPSVRIYRVPEPQVDANEVFGRMTIGPAETIELTYPDKPQDAETLLLDPETRDLYIISKREFFNRVYVAPYPQSTSSPTPLKRVPVTMPLGFFAVAGDVSPDGREIIVRTPTNASLWRRTPGTPLWEALQQTAVGIPLKVEPQGEAIGFDGLGRGYFTISEMKNPPLYYFARSSPQKATALSDKPAVSAP